MNSIDDLFRDLSVIAPAMENLEKKPEARVLYDELSGSLFWTDERPKGALVNGDCLRFVLHYRTGLLIGRPRDTWQHFWLEAKRCFPNWIGFSPERVGYSEKLA